MDSNNTNQSTDIPELTPELPTTKPPYKKTPPPHRYSVFSKAPMRMILESEILAAQSMSRTEKQVSRKLGVAFETYKKYAQLYGIYGRVMNQGGKGTSKPVKNEDGGRYPLKRILTGEFPDYPLTRLKYRLIRSHTMEPKCCRCGFCEKREVDGKYPIILGFKDGNDKNKKGENLQFYCYNCYFLEVNTPKGRRAMFRVQDV